MFGCFFSIARTRFSGSGKGKIMRSLSSFAGGVLPMANAANRVVIELSMMMLF